MENYQKLTEKGLSVALGVVASHAFANGTIPSWMFDEVVLLYGSVAICLKNMTEEHVEAFNKAAEDDEVYKTTMQLFEVK